MGQFSDKRIIDPVHGTISLSELETKVIDTPVFQRLRNVKQLGFAHYVFPGADYSRFAHSLGVCHLVGKSLDTLKSIDGGIEDDEVQDCRLAGLLHDVGHYPFSHAFEEALESYFKGKMVVPAGMSMPAAGGSPEPALTREAQYVKHESVGKLVLSLNKVLQDIVGAERAQRVVQLFTHAEDSSVYANLVSSDLDADRTDYMLRTAVHSGLPYGSVDIEYLISQLTFDSERRVCVNAKALRAADHFLLCRYFDYQQVAFHKSVAAFELVLKQVVRAMLGAGKLVLDRKKVGEMISGGEWISFDDGYVLGLIREFSTKLKSTDPVQVQCTSILSRKPPKLLGEIEMIKEDDATNEKQFAHYRRALEKKLDEWADKYSIDRKLWYLWDINNWTLTKIGSSVPASKFLDDAGTGSADLGKTKDKYKQVVRVKHLSDDGSEAIVDLPNSLMRVLSKHGLYSIRVYAHVPDEVDSKVIRKEICSSDFPWKT